MYLTLMPPLKKVEKKLIASLVISIFFIFLSYSTIPFYHFNITIQTESSGIAQLFYDTGKGFNEEQSCIVNIKPGKNQYSFSLPSDSYKNLRFDPINRDGTVFISSVSISDVWGGPVLIIPISSFVPANQVEKITYFEDQAEIKIQTAASDPIFLIKNQYPITLPINFIYLIDVFFAIFILTLIAYYKLPIYLDFNDKSYIPLFFGISTGLILSMATLSAINYSVHPDEFSHISVSIYYFNHWLPPPVGDSNTLSTYSIYGTSYLNELDIVYFLAAKFAKWITPLVGSSVFALRLFNIMLFVILLIYISKNSLSRWVLLIFLISPQIWYIFSYFNADAFPLFAATMLVVMLTNPSSSISKYLRGEEELRPRIAIFICLLAGLFLSKINYYVFIPFLGYYYFLSKNLIAKKTLFISCLGFFMLLFSVLYKKTFIITPENNIYENEIIFSIQASGLILALLPIIFIKDIRERFRFSGIYPQRWLLILCMSFMILVTRIGYDFYINGMPSQKREQIINLAERLAGENFKPSNYGKPNSYSGIMLKSQGIQFIKIFDNPYQWTQISLNSFFGVYGYMSIISNSNYYRLITNLVAILLVFILIQILNPFNVEILYKSITLSVFMFLTLFVSAHHSWVSDFQPQGRYLFPIIPMLGFFIVDNKAKLKNPWFDVIIIIMFSLSVYSFLFGIHQIQKF